MAGLITDRYFFTGENYCLVGCGVMYYGRYLQLFWRNLPEYFKRQQFS
jgi:hypothetical protein